MRMVISFVIIASLLFSSAHAEDDYRAIAIDAKNHIPQKISVYRQDAEDAKNSAKNITIPCENDVSIIKNNENEIINKNMETQLPKKMMTSILIFVSFSMPRQSLEAYLRDAKKIHASVVIRGLIDNSFQKTFQRIADLVKSSDGDGVELNPLWFKRFSIQIVPAVVVVPTASPCFKNDICKKESDFDLMTGDITLVSALKEINNKSNLTNEITQSAISTLQGGSHG